MKSLALCLILSERSVRSVPGRLSAQSPSTRRSRSIPAAETPEPVPRVPFERVGYWVHRRSPASTWSPEKHNPDPYSGTSRNPFLRGTPELGGEVGGHRPPGNLQESRGLQRRGDHAPVSALPAPAAPRSPPPPWPQVLAAPPASWAAAAGPSSLRRCSLQRRAPVTQPAPGNDGPAASPSGWVPRSLAHSLWVSGESVCTRVCVSVAKQGVCVPKGMVILPRRWLTWACVPKVALCKLLRLAAYISKLWWECAPWISVYMCVPPC